MKISNFKYIITDIGGGWGYNHQLYGVTPDGEVYTTEKFNEDNFSLDNELEVELLGNIDTIELGLSEKVGYAVMDASDITVYDVGDTIEIVHQAPDTDYNNPIIFESIKELKRAIYIKSSNRFISENKDNIVIGEIKSSEVIKTMSILNSGHPAHTTFHASNNQELIDKLREELISEQTASN